MKQRFSGILLHLTSLPGNNLCGDLGASAYHFVDWLCSAKQTLWQMLPFGGLGPGNSPYMSPSAFAGNELLISLESLVHSGWLSSESLPSQPEKPPTQVDYQVLRTQKEPLLRQAASNALGKEPDTFKTFCSQHKSWLDDYARFMTIAEQYPEHAWYHWPQDLAQRVPQALAAIEKKYASSIHYWKFCQWCFHEQWQALRQYANERAIFLIGDMPIFVAAHSADVWANPSLFKLNSDGAPRVIAGVPPDYFSATGQRWGNPLYQWEAHQKTDFHWWKERIRRTYDLCDIVRIDHFRGFESYWEIPAEAESAINGSWQQGPGIQFFQSLAKTIQPPTTSRHTENTPPPMIAEDLGIITPAVTTLRQQAGLPGMSILQFAFDGHMDNLYLPHNHTIDNVVYTGTHDNDTTNGWWYNCSDQEKDLVRQYLSTDAMQINWDLTRCAMASVAQICIVPMQDIIGLDSSARMNQPGADAGCWTWRYQWSQVEPWHAERLALMSFLYHRNQPLEQPTA